MSKIGKVNIDIPDKVKVAISGSAINIEGPKGKKTITMDIDMFDVNVSVSYTHLRAHDTDS